MSMDRRTLLKGAAWSVPVIAAAVAAPVAAASGGAATCTDGGAGFYVVGDRTISVHYAAAPDIYEINVHYADGSSESFGTNFGSAPARGSVDWIVPVRQKPAWVQVHTFNTHFGEPTCGGVR